MFTLGLAYCGTANNSAISRLLHVSVSDVSDDVRRAAVMNLGFLLCSQPEQCPKIVSLLAESFNPHVRYGATLAVGISCAGSGLKEAISLLEPMAKDPVDFVRQGAMIALAMIVIQTSQGENSKVEKNPPTL
jgi:26S proteasome regulatory subunit N2